MNATRKHTFLNHEEISVATYTLIQRVEATAISVIRTVALWIKRHQERKQLLDLNDRVLADIGLTRSDVHKELNKPFWRA